MGNITRRPRLAALISFLLCLPLTLLLSIAAFEIEPFNGLLQILFTEAAGYRQRLFSAAVLIGAFLLLPIAFIIVRAPIAWTMGKGGSLFAYPVNLVLAVAILIFITMLVGGFIVDQYPCWVGVPNCD